MASPNPTNGDLYVSTTKEKPEVKALSKDENLRIELYDFYTKHLVKFWNFKNDQKQYKLNVRGLKKGQYVLQVLKGKYRQSKQIVVN